MFWCVCHTLACRFRFGSELTLFLERDQKNKRAAHALLRKCDFVNEAETLRPLRSAPHHTKHAYSRMHALPGRILKPSASGRQSWFNASSVRDRTGVERTGPDCMQLPVPSCADGTDTSLPLSPFWRLLGL